nr:zinc finger, CCHC-type [Tanacetum cinerariifolium]
MAGNTVKEMTMNFELLEDATVEAIRIREKWENDDYYEGNMAEDSSSKKFLVSNFNNYNMVFSRPVMEQYNELLRIPGQYTQHGLKIDESIFVLSIIDKFPPSWKDFKHTLKHGKDDLSLVQLGSHLRIEESLRVQDSDKGKGKEVGGPSVNMTEEGDKNKHHKQNKGKNDPIRTTVVLVPTRNQSWNVRSVVDVIAWWIDSGAPTHVCKDRCWFKTYVPVEDGSVLYMGDDHFAPVHGIGCVALEFSSRKSVTLFNVMYVPKLRKNLVSGPVLNKCGYKQVCESDKYILSKSGKPVDQLEYSRAIGCLMYTMISTKPDIAYVVGRLSRFTSNPSRQHWKAITRVFKYLRGTMNYGLSFVGYPLVLEAYSDASWINHVEDSSSTSGWVFMLRGGAISWASKKQTCITGSTMESEFVALAAAGKEAEWLRNLIHEIPIWPKTIAPISI